MYNTLATCTYNKEDEIFLETDDITSFEKEFIQNVIYRQELMDIFELEEYDNTLFQERLHNVYERVKTYAPFHPCILSACATIQSTDEEMGWIVLFSYDYLSYTHACICEYFIDGQMSEETMHSLKNALSSS
jgi:hypothetical protein